MHCVCVDVPSAYTATWRIYYIYYRYSDALHYVSVDVPSEYSAVWRIYCTHRRYVVASYHADPSVPPVLYWMHQMDMDHAHHRCVDVHSKYSVKRGVKTTTPRYTAIIQTKNCTQLYYIYNIITKATNSYMLQTLQVHNQGHVNTFNRSTSCSKLLWTILSATHIIHQEFPAALLHASDQYIKHSF